MELLKKFDVAITKIEEFIVGAGIVVVTFLVFWGVVTRFIFKFSLTWGEEASQYMMLWIAFVGCILCVKKSEHVGVDIIYHLIPKKYNTLLLGVLAIVSAAFMLFFAYTAFEMYESVRINRQMSPSIKWLKMSLVYLSAPLCSILMAYEFMKLGILSLTKWKESPQEGNIEEKI